MMPLLQRLFFCLLLSVVCTHVQAEPVVYTSGALLIGGDISILEDKQNALTPEAAFASDAFVPSTQQVPNFDISSSTFWIRFTFTNATGNRNVQLEVENALLDTCELYVVENGQLRLLASYGSTRPYRMREYDNPTFLFDLAGPDTAAHEYMLKIRGTEQMVVPLIVGATDVIAEQQSTRHLVTGVLAGILLIMMIYNFFLYASIRDKSYLYYVLFILFIGLTQLTLPGFTYEYLFAGYPRLFNYSIVVFASLAGISALYFIRTFLHTKVNTPTWDKVLVVFIVLYTAAGVVRLAGQDQLSSRMVDVAALLASLAVYALVIQLSLRRYQPAKFLFVAWTVFLVGLVLFVLRNFNVLPYNNFTNYTMQLGIAAEVALLSIALADKINILDREKKASQANELKTAKENERIIREQNVMLETKVSERTQDLEVANQELNKTLTDLQEAEMQLVESEKMASLGQLTAGIAHEINNPINFVTSNVKPLKRDIDMVVDMLAQVETIGLSESTLEEKQEKLQALKQEYDFDYLKSEIEYLLKGIGEGSNRTAEIVKGLRVFSRLDEDDLKKADINEGLDSTLIIVNNLLSKVQIAKDYAELPLIDCYPGKLNQVFLNIISNAVHAIKKRHGENPGGVLTIKTFIDDNQLHIIIADNGTGMDENTKKKLFEPFFTTKDVGEGTGLGLSIAYNTIQKHNGQIHVESEVGVGTEFSMTIPLIYNNLA